MSITDNNKNSLDRKKTVGKTLIAIGRWLLIIAVSYVILYPLLSMVSTSLKAQADMLDPAVVWVPRHFSLTNFDIAIKAMDFWNSLFVTFKYNILSALIEVFTCLFTAYGFARFKFKFKSVFIVILIVSIVLPSEMLIVSTYTQMSYYDVFGILKLAGNIFGKELRPNLIDTGWAMWLPSIFAVGVRSGLFIFIYMQFLKNLPNELEEAASIDGAGPVKTFFKVIIPSSGVVILTITIFSIIWHWNEYLTSTILYTDHFSLAVQLSQLETRLTTIGVRDSGLLLNGIIMAACLLFVLPMLIMYMFLQKYFIQSIDRVGIVG